MDEQQPDEDAVTQSTHPKPEPTPRSSCCCNPTCCRRCLCSFVDPQPSSFLEFFIFSLALPLLFFAIVISISTTVPMHLPPIIPKADDPPYSHFSSARAYADLKNLTSSFSTRVLFSSGNLESADWILSRVGEILDELSESSDSVFNVTSWTQDFFISNYTPGWKIPETLPLQNVLVRVVDSNSGSGCLENDPERCRFLLLASHYDSVCPSGGASDDGVAVVTLLEILRFVLGEKKSFAENTALLLLWNNGEEANGDYYGASAFVRHFEMIESIGRFLNLESMATAGRPIVFRLHPSGVAAELPGLNSLSNSIGGDINKIIPSGTDFTIYTEEAHLAGIDAAFFANGWFYHTIRDAFASVPQGSVQSMGNLAEAAVRKYLYPNVKGKRSLLWEEPSNTSYVFFDILGGKTFVVSRTVMGVLSAVVFVLTLFFLLLDVLVTKVRLCCVCGQRKMAPETCISRWRRTRTWLLVVLVHFLGFILSTILGIGGSLLFAAFGLMKGQLGYFSHYKLALVLYSFGSTAGILVGQILVLSLRLKRNEDFWLEKFEALLFFFAFFNLFFFRWYFFFGYAVFGLLVALPLWFVSLAFGRLNAVAEVEEGETSHLLSKELKEDAETGEKSDASAKQSSEIPLFRSLGNLKSFCCPRDCTKSCVAARISTALFPWIFIFPCLIVIDGMYRIIVTLGPLFGRTDMPLPPAFIVAGFVGCTVVVVTYPIYPWLLQGRNLFKVLIALLLFSFFLLVSYVSLGKFSSETPSWVFVLSKYESSDVFDLSVGNQTIPATYGDAHTWLCLPNNLKLTLKHPLLQTYRDRVGDQGIVFEDFPDLNEPCDGARLQLPNGTSFSRVGSYELEVFSSNRFGLSIHLNDPSTFSWIEVISEGNWSVVWDNDPVLQEGNTFYRTAVETSVWKGMFSSTADVKLEIHVNYCGVNSLPQWVKDVVFVPNPGYAWMGEMITRCELLETTTTVEVGLG